MICRRMLAEPNASDCVNVFWAGNNDMRIDPSKILPSLESMISALKGVFC